MRRTALLRRTRLTYRRATKPATVCAVDALVRARDGACLTCGSTSDLVVNHRKTGMGGNRPEGAEWKTLACWVCNERYENDRQADAYRYGWKLRAGQDPCATPVLDAGGLWWLLAADGTRQPCPDTDGQQCEDDRRR